MKLFSTFCPITIVFILGTAFGATSNPVQAISSTVSQTVSISDPKVKVDYENALKLLNTQSPQEILNMAAESTGTRGGGDITLSQKKALSEWMQSGQLNTVVANYAKRIDVSKATNSDAVAIWNLMTSNGILLDDIQNSKYVPSESCVTGSDPNWTASSIIGGRALHQTDICFDVNKIVGERSSLASLIALALHEHAHHYGFGEAGAYLVTEMVGAQINSFEINNSQSIADQLTSSSEDNRLASSIKKGSKLKLRQNLDKINNPYFQNGRVYSGSGEVSLGVDCWLQGYIEPGKTYTILSAVSGWSDTRTPSVTVTDVAFTLDPSGVLTCERHPDSGAQITASEVHDALDGIFDLKLKF